jgi:hypothetical protein
MGAINIRRQSRPLPSIRKRLPIVVPSAVVRNVDLPKRVDGMPGGARQAVDMTVN